MDSAFARLKEEMREYYAPLRHAAKGLLPARMRQARERIAGEMDAFANAHPGIHPSLFKAAQMEILAKHFQPKIFPHSPFFFEMGLRPAENWGTAEGGHYGSGMYMRFAEEVYKMPEFQALAYWSGYSADALAFKHSGYWWANGIGFDNDHHCLGYALLLSEGVNGVLAQVRARRNAACGADQTAELEAMERGLRALLLVAERFADEAEKLLAEATDPEVRGNLKLAAQAARHVPAHPPRTFHEGLASLWFLREATATLESIGVSVIGHPDRQLIQLYRADLAAGRITESEAKEMVALWMLPTDVKFFVQENSWPETSTCMMLGGCDANGDAVWNELTRLFITAHKEYSLINPKLNCRFSKESPQEYLELLSETALTGHNHFAFLNDDALIPANVKYGKTEAEARLYVNGGCQETMCEGVEHTAGAYFYYSMPAILSDWFGECLSTEGIPELAKLAMPQQMQICTTFEEFYRQTLDALATPLKAGLRWMKACGELHWRINPCPMFSATLAGCIESGTDYARGGAKYNLSGISLVGLGNVVNMLNAVRVGVFEEKWTTLAELRCALLANWEGYENLRLRLSSLALHGHGISEVDALTARLMEDMAALCRTIANERGSYFQPSFFVYYAFKKMGSITKATPDGRRQGDLFCQGIAPDRRNAPKSLPEIFRTLRAVDFSDYPGNAVLDVQLPAGNAIPPKTLAATLRAFARMGGPTLQVNCANAEELKAAQLDPASHSGLVVRISGLSACFVQLTKEVQDEIISRAVAACA